MNATCTIETCDRPVPDTSFVCPGCGARMRALLLRVADDVTPPGLVTYLDRSENPPVRRQRRAVDGGRTVYGIASSLDHVIAHQVRVGRDITDPTPLAISETPLPYNPAASEVRSVLVSALVFWTAAVSEQRGTPVDDWTPAGMATWLAAQVDWMRAQDAGPDAFDELTAALRQAERATDRPADRRYAGPCTTLWPVIPFVEATQPCGTDLYAHDHRDTVTCPTCDTEYPIEARRAWLLEQAHDRLLPAGELCRAVDGLGVPVSRDTVKSWVRRDQLVARGHVVGYLGRQVAIYRVGDVLDLVEAAARRRGTLVTVG